MTAQQFYEWMAGVSDGQNLTLPLPIGIGPHDAMAARLILWLVEQMPEDANQGDIERVLDSAKFWVMFWASAYLANLLEG